MRIQDLNSAKPGAGQGSEHPGAVQAGMRLCLCVARVWSGGSVRMSDEVRA